MREMLPWILVILWMLAVDYTRSAFQIEDENDSINQ